MSGIGEGRVDGSTEEWEDDPGRSIPPAISPPRSGTASADEDASIVGIKIEVRDNEPLSRALYRLGRLTRVRDKGPFEWMRVASWAKATKAYYQKPSFLKRMKRYRKRFLAQKWSYCCEGGKQPDLHL
jgi:hypothetical protein